VDLRLTSPPFGGSTCSALSAPLDDLDFFAELATVLADHLDLPLLGFVGDAFGVGGGRHAARHLERLAGAAAGSRLDEVVAVTLLLATLGLL